MDRNKEMDLIPVYRSAFRGYIWLSTPLPFLFLCSGYLAPTPKAMCRLITASFLMLFLYVMFHRYDTIRIAMKKQGLPMKQSTWKTWLGRLGMILFAVFLVGQFLTPEIPFVVKGIYASVYYLVSVIRWYRKTNDPRRKGNEKEAHEPID